MSRVKLWQQSVQRLVAVVVSAAFVLTMGAQLLPSVASGASGGQVTNRSITMSSSKPFVSGDPTVTYTVAFKPVTTEANPDIIINFCNSSSDPIPGDTCNGTAGTDVPDTTSAAASGWTVTSIDSHKSIKLTTSSVTITSGSLATITITGIKNPSNTTGFYGRIMTYANGGSSGYVSPTSLGSNVDYGGIALSTASNINITSKVFETLTFCVYTSSCGTAPNLTLGDPTTQALSTGNTYINTDTAYNLATNASNGVQVVLRGTTLCRSSTLANCQPGANYNANTIAAIGGTATAPVSPGSSEQFGMCADINSSAALTVATPYFDTTSNCHGLGSSGTYSGSAKFGFDDSSGSSTNSATGSSVISSSGAVASMTGGFAFMANITPTTEAGIYTTSLNMVATGTF